MVQTSKDGNMTGKNNYIESTNRIYMDPIIFHLIMSIAFAKKYDT